MVRRADGRGRPEKHNNRAALNGFLWVLCTGAAWADMPDRFPSGSTCFRRFSRWNKTGVLRQNLEALAPHLDEHGWIDLAERFIDGTYAMANKGAPKWERPSAARVRKSWSLQAHRHAVGGPPVCITRVTKPATK